MHGQMSANKSGAAVKLLGRVPNRNRQMATHRANRVRAPRLDTRVQGPGLTQRLVGDRNLAPTAELPFRPGGEKRGGKALKC